MYKRLPITIIPGLKEGRILNYSYNSICNCRYFSSSFIHEVMNQVKKELESNPSLKKSLHKAQESTSMEFIHQLKDYINRYKNQFYIYHKTYQKYLHSFESLCRQSSNTLFNIPFKKYPIYNTKYISFIYRQYDFILNQLKHIVSYYSDDQEDQVRQRIKQWKQKKDNTSMNFSTSQNTHDQETETESTDSLAVIKPSVWDTFGNIYEMPFLSKFFKEGPLNSIFGESAQAATLREMKIIDPTFKLPELLELLQHIISYHILENFLSGNQEVLRLHCGDSLYSILKESLKERQITKVEFDSRILAIRHVEFRSAISVQDSMPWFIFTFAAQHINCVRNKLTQKIVAGSIDDIREVIYSIAVRKHPNPELPELDYPWQIMEFAILQNNPSW